MVISILLSGISVGQCGFVFVFFMSLGLSTLDVNSFVAYFVNQGKFVL